VGLRSGQLRVPRKDFLLLHDHASPDNLFDIEVEHRDGVVVVRPIGELDMATAPELRAILQDLRNQKASVVIDLKDLTFLDSTGLRLIWDADAEARKDGLDLTLTVGPPDVMRVFEVTGLTRRLNFTDLN
jgi:anti-anti-sigma factor